MIRFSSFMIYSDFITLGFSIQLHINKKMFIMMYYLSFHTQLRLYINQDKMPFYDCAIHPLSLAILKSYLLFNRVEWIISRKKIF